MHASKHIHTYREIICLFAPIWTKELHCLFTQTSCATLLEGEIKKYNLKKRAKMKLERKRGASKSHVEKQMSILPAVSLSASLSATLQLNSK